MRLDTIPFPILFIFEDWCQSAARLLPGASRVAAVQGSGGFEKLLTQSNLEQETTDQSDPASVEADGCQLTLVCSLQCAPVMSERRRSQPYLTRDQNQRLATLRHRYTLWSYKLILKQLLNHRTKFHCIDFLWPLTPSSFIDICYLASNKQVICQKSWEMSSRKNIRFLGLVKIDPFSDGGFLKDIWHFC